MAIARNPQPAMAGMVIKPATYHWDEQKIGPGAPPIKTAAGWLSIYHGVFSTMCGGIYRLGVALHDLGAAAAHFALQAAELGLQAHQMAGVQLDKVRTTYAIPDGYDPQTAIALGYPDPQPGDSEFAQRDAGPRARKTVPQQVFSGTWEQPAF